MELKPKEGAGGSVLLEMRLGCDPPVEFLMSPAESKRFSTFVAHYVDEYVKRHGCLP